MHELGVSVGLFACDAVICCSDHVRFFSKIRLEQVLREIFKDKQLLIRCVLPWWRFIASDEVLSDYSYMMR